MTAPVTLGDAVVVVERSRHPNVAHRLKVVRPVTFLYPYIMACGYATTTVLPAAEGLQRCRRCWA